MKNRISKFFSRMLFNDSCELSLDNEEIDALVSNINPTRCGLPNEELRKVAEAFDRLPSEQKKEIVEAIVDKKLYIAQICERYHITRMSVNRWQQKGKLPPFRRDIGGKDFLFTHEADEWVRRWNMEHPDIA